MHVLPIRTASDLRQAIADGARLHYVAIPDALERDARHLLDELFEDFSLVDPGVDPPGLVTALLDSAAESLADIRRLGLQLVAVKWSGAIAGAGGRPMPWTQSDFVVAPEPLWFRREGDARELVHLLGAPCANGHQVFAGDDVAIRCWLLRELIDQTFEQRVPWCSTCSLAEIESS